VRPALKPGLLPVWRDRDTLQIGIDPRRAVALTGMSEAAWVISLLDGSRDRAQVIAAAGDRGIPEQVAERVLTLLAAGGALDDFPAGLYRALPRQERRLLAPELAASSLAHGDGDGGARTLARRRAAHVRLHGGGRLGRCMASLLATSGIGWVVSADAQQDGSAATPADPDLATADRNPDTAPWPRRDAATAELPAGPDPATASAVSRAPTTDAGPASATRRTAARGRPARLQAAGIRPDLVVLTGTPVPELTSMLMRDRIPHLAVSASEAIGVVGPLVVPGQSACLRCLNLSRTDRDPAWPLILAQLTGRQADPPACDAALVAAVAALATTQALSFIDRPARTGPVTNGTLELVLPAWQWRRRTWPPHRDCACARSSPG
jgi:bacteriocin biosynthesis cyclodehydratase domain-containing protein